MSKESRRINDRTRLAPCGLLLLGEFSEDRGEDQEQFVRLFPKDASLLGLSQLSGRNHPQPVLGFSRLFLTGTDFLAKLLARDGIIRLAVVCTDACRGLDNLTHQRLRDRVEPQAPT